MAVDINNPKYANRVISPENLHTDPVYVLYENGQPVGEQVQVPNQ